MSTDLDTDTASVHALFQSYDGMEGLTAARSHCQLRHTRPDGARFSFGYIRAYW